MSEKFRPARTLYLALTSVSLAVMGACSLFAPTEAELSGGRAARDEEVKAGAGAAAGDDTGGARGDSGASSGGIGLSGGGQSGGAGGTGGVTAGAAGGTAGAAGGTAGTGGAAGSNTCVPDVTSKAPKASSLVDGFSDGTAAPKFRIDGDLDTCALEKSGRVVVDLPQPAPAGYFCFYETLQVYDLTCDGVVLKVPQVAGPALGVQTYLYVGPDPAHLVMVVVENGSYLFSTDAKAFINVGQYDSGSPWWRLREASVGGQRKVIFETSPDAAAWTERYSVARPFALDSVKVSFGAGAYRASASSGSSLFACYNAPAGCD